MGSLHILLHCVRIACKTFFNKFEYASLQFISSIVLVRVCAFAQVYHQPMLLFLQTLHHQNDNRYHVSIMRIMSTCFSLYTYTWDISSKLTLFNFAEIRCSIISQYNENLSKCGVLLAVFACSGN